MEDRLLNLFGVAALAATTRLRSAVESDLAHGGSAPATLVHLQSHPGDSIEGLRKVLGISQPATVRLIDRLAAEGLVERRPGRDRRTLALHLTAVGADTAAGVLQRRAQSLRPLLEVLEADEKAALESVLERVVSALADDLPHALRVCRLCDRAACTSGPGCPLGHTTGRAAP